MKKLLLSLLTGILLFISWPNNGLSFFIFFAFIPLFVLSDMILKKGLSSFSAIKRISQNDMSSAAQTDIGDICLNMNWITRL